MCSTSFSCRLWMLIPIFCIFLAPEALAQLGRFNIDVIDSVTERPLADVRIKILPRNGAPVELLTDEAGEASSRSIPTGLYELTISQAGYRTVRLPSVRVVTDKSIRVPVRLVKLKEPLEEVLVFGTSASVNNLDSVGSSVFDREQLRSAAGSGSDVLRALDGLPGLFSDGAFSTFTVRGNGPRDNLILVDGIPFDNVVHFRDSFGDDEGAEGGGRYSVFAPNLIGSAEFQPGGWNARYGGRAGSLLKLDVAEGNRETASYTARLDVAGIEVGYDGPSRIHEDTSVLFSARRLNFGRLFEMIGLEDIGTPELTDVILKTATELSERDDVSVLLIYAPESYTRDIDNVLASDEERPGVFEDVELADVERDNALLGVTWSRFVGASGKLTNRFYYRGFDEKALMGDAFPDLVVEGTPSSAIPVRPDLLSSSREEIELGWRLDFEADNTLGRYALGSRLVQLDLDFSLRLKENWNRFEYDQDDARPSPEQKFIVLTPEAINTDFEETAMQYVVYGDQTFISDTWDIRLGGRVEYDELSGETVFTPRLGWSWFVNERLRSTMTLGRYFQAPSLSDRAEDATNRSLINERIDQVSLGIEYEWKRGLTWFLEPYYQSLSKLVVPQDNVNRTVANTGEGESYGFDMALSRQFKKGWSGDIQYSYNESVIQESEGAPEIDTDFSRPHIFSVGSIWEVNDRWKISGRWKWASGKPRDEFIVNENVLGDGNPLRFSKEITAQNTERFGNFNSLNIRIDYRRSFGRADFIAFLDVINVTASDNPNATEFNERSGENVVEEGDAFPLLGLRVTW